MKFATVVESSELLSTSKVKNRFVLEELAHILFCQCQNNIFEIQYYKCVLHLNRSLLTRTSGLVGLCFEKQKPHSYFLSFSAANYIKILTWMEIKLLVCLKVMFTGLLIL